MYEDQFGLTGRPFQLTPDPAFWFETGTHRRAMAYLGYGLAQGEGFIVITGDIGAGKTTLVGHLLQTVDRQSLNPIKIVSTAIEASDLLRIVATQLGVEPAGLHKAELLIAIERALHGVARTGRRTLLVVDEAQALPVDALEELRMLSNFQSGGHALLQIVLLGQPEFRERLQGSDRLEQLRQRVIAIHHLDPMLEEEVAPYIAHRLAVVGWNGRPDFAESSFPALHRATDGVPRRLNQLANRVMLHAAVEGVEVIDAAVVDMVLADFNADLSMVRGGGSATVPAESATPPVAAAVPVEELQPTPPPLPAWMQPDMLDHAAQQAVEEVADVADPVMPADPVAEPGATAEEVVVPPASSAAPDPAMDERLAALEARIEAQAAQIEAQDAALRRVLTLLVDWVEAEQPAPRPAFAPLRPVAA